MAADLVISILGNVISCLICLPVAAALYFDEPTDESAVELKELRETKGIPYILTHICGLSAEEELYRRVLEAAEELKQEGLVK